MPRVLAVVRVGGIERTDVRIGVEDESHRCWSSRSSRSRHPAE
jgi:hypothetical protein